MTGDFTELKVVERVGFQSTILMWFQDGTPIRVAKHIIIMKMGTAWMIAQIIGTWIHCLHCLQMQVENANFYKDCVHCIVPIYIRIQVGTTKQSYI